MTPTRASCLYFGRVMHRRLRPFGHRFDYRVFSMLLDLDELPELAHRLPLFSHNRWNVFSFQNRDHGPRDGSALRPWIEAQLASRGIDLEGGRISLLCFPRVLGYVFNPLSIWFCHHRDGSLRALLYEVRNTFGDKHGYLIPLETPLKPGAPILQGCDKRFYVSPFIGMESRYRFRVKQPDETLSVLIRQSVPEGELLLATWTGKRHALTGRNLAFAFFRYPLMTLKIVAAIHWQALKLWRKGARFHKRPQPPADDIELVGPQPAHAAE
ncbi:MAG: DUF1365 domain-containing protein [Rhodovibrionaceae bacterium]